MQKWIGIRGQNGEHMMIPLDSVKKIYCSNLKKDEDECLYFIAFVLFNEEINTVYTRKIKRDHIYHELCSFINQKKIFFYDLLGMEKN